MLKTMFNYLIDSYSLSDSPLENYIQMLIIGCIALVIAYKLVGKLYVLDIIDGSMAGKFFHWFIRLIVFIVLFYVCSFIMSFYKWFILLPEYVQMGIKVSIVVTFVFVQLLVYLKRQKRIRERKTRKNLRNSH